MCRNDQTLDFEAMLTDPLIRLVMKADGVSEAELWSVLTVARDAVVGRDRFVPSAEKSARAF